MSGLPANASCSGLPVAQRNTTDSSDILLLQSPGSFDHFTARQKFVIVKSALLFLLMFVGLFGNSLVLVAYWTTPRLWTKSNMLVASFASIDMLETGPTIIFYVAYHLLVYVFFNDSCKYRQLVAILIPLQRLPTNVIEFHMFSIGMDRYFAITNPLHYETKITETKVRIAIACCWLYGCWYCALSFAFLANVDWASCDPVYPTLLFPILDFLTNPVAILALVIIYGKILHIAMKHRSQIDATEAQLVVGGGGQTAAGAASASKGEALKKQRKAFKGTLTTLAIVCPYMLSWLPFMVGRAVQVSGVQSSALDNWIEITVVLGVTGQATDWIFYGFTNKVFRNAFKRILVQRRLKPTPSAD